MHTCTDNLNTILFFFYFNGAVTKTNQLWSINWRCVVINHVFSPMTGSGAVIFEEVGESN